MKDFWKKLLVFVLALSMMISLCSCSLFDRFDDDDDDRSERDEDDDEDDDDDDDDEDDDDDDDDEDDDDEDDTGPTKSVTFAEQVLFNQGGIEIKVTGIDMEPYLGPEINFSINNGSDKSILVQIQEASVNGFMVNMILYNTVSAGKKSNQKVYIPASELEKAGIMEISEIEFKFQFIA